MRRRLAAWLMVVSLNGAATAALAVHQATDPEPQKPVFQWIFALVMVGLICAVAFKNPKRSHQS